MVFVYYVVIWFDEYCGVEVVFVWCEFGVVDIEVDVEFLCFVEKGLVFWGGYGWFEIVLVDFCLVFYLLVWEECGEGEFWEDDELRVYVVCFA